MNTITVKPGQTLQGIYGNDWQKLSGYKGDPTKLAVGTVLPAPGSSTRSNFTQTPISSPSVTQVPKSSYSPQTSFNQPKVMQETKPFVLNQSSQLKPIQADWATQQTQTMSAPKLNSTTPNAKAPTQSSNPTENQATTQAIKSGANPGLLDRARQFLGQQAYIGLCQAFVEKATKGREGIYTSAIDAWKRQQDKARTNLADIRPGDAVYFAPDSSNGGYGHTGVYAGNGQFISATYNGIKQVNLNDWVKSTGQRLLGFIPGDDRTDFSTPNDQNLGWMQQKAQEFAKAPAVEGSAVSSPSFVEGTPDWVQPIINKASKKYNIPPVLLSALLKKESGFDPNAKSPVGAQGIAQFMPDTAKELGIDPNDPEQAIEGAAKYLRLQWDKFGKPELALAAYNSGAGNVQNFGGIPPFKETKNYVKGIMDLAGGVHRTAYDPMLDLISNAKKQS